MSKRAIINWCVWGVVAMMPGTILIPASALALAAHNQGVSDTYGRTMVGLIVLGGLFILAGVIALLVAWVAAVINTRQLADTRWFTAVLWGGIAGLLAAPLGLGALVFTSVMMAYLVAGPDGLAAQPQPTTPAKTVITKWAGRGFAAAAAGGVLALLVANLTYPGRLLHGVGWPSLLLVSLGFTAIGAGLIVAWAAWWAAIFNAHRLADKTWFSALLWSGIAATLTMPFLGFGALILVAVLIAYWHWAPDGMAGQLAAGKAAAPPAGSHPPTHRSAA